MFYKILINLILQALSNHIETYNIYYDYTIQIMKYVPTEMCVQIMWNLRMQGKSSQNIGLIK